MEARSWFRRLLVEMNLVWYHSLRSKKEQAQSEQLDRQWSLIRRPVLNLERRRKVLRLDKGLRAAM